MNRKTLPQHFRKSALALTAAMLAPAAVLALPASEPVGGEVQVNTYTTGYQGSGSVAMDADGDFVAVWQSDGQDGSNGGIYAQRYNAVGEVQGSEFRVNTHTANQQGGPSVAMDSDGDFVVVWTSEHQDGSSHGIYAQRYNAAGVAQGSEFRVNTHTTFWQLGPKIAMDADGDFVIAWTSNLQDGSDDGVYAQRYNAAGEAQGGEFRINTYTADNQGINSIAMDADGDFVVTWTSNGQDGSSFGVYAQRYTAAGQAQGAEFRVNTFTTDMQSTSSVAMDADGDFAVVWRSSGQDGSSYGISAQRYNSAGTAQGGEFQINTHTVNAQRPSRSIAMDADGDFVVTWQSNLQDGASEGIYAQRYNAAGVAQGDEFRVNTYTTSSQSSPVIAMDADGDFVVAWESAGQESPITGFYAQRFVHPPADTVPNTFSFTNATNLAPNTYYQSKGITVSGINMEVPISVTGGEYRINGGTWNTAASTVSNGQTVQIRLLTASALSTTKRATLTIGGVSAQQITKTYATPPPDTVPDVYTFANSNGVAKNALVQTKGVVPVGYDTATTVTITGTNCQYRVAGGAWGSTAGSISPTQNIQLRTTTPATAYTKFNCTVKVGGVASQWLGKTGP